MRSMLPRLLSAALLLGLACTPSLNQPLHREPAPVEAERAQQLQIEGWAALWANDFSGAAARFDEALALDPGLAAALRGRGLTRWSQVREEEALSDFVAALRIDPDQPCLVPIRDFLDSQLMERLAVADAIARLDRELLCRPERPLWVRREGWTNLDRFQRNVRADPLAWRNCADSLHWIGGWELLGPYSNLARSGFERAFIDESAASQPNAPLLTLATGAKALMADPSGPTLRGLDNVPIAWFLPSPAQGDGYMRIGRRLGQRSHSAGYARCALSVDQGGDQIFVLTHAGAIRVWIDGEEVFADDSYGSGNERHWFHRNLAAGEHRVLVKTACEAKAMTFALARHAAVDEPGPWTDLDGVPGLLGTLEGLRTTNSAQLADPLYLQLANEIESGPNPVEARFWLAFMMGIKNHHQAAREVLDGLPEELAGSHLLRWMRKLGIEDEGEEPGQARAIVQRILADGAGFPRAQAALLEELIMRESLRPADKALEKLRAQAPDWTQTKLLEAMLLIARSDMDGAFLVVERAAQATPDCAELYKLQLLRAAKHLEDEQIEALLEKIAASGERAFVDHQRLRRRLDRKDFAGAKRLLSHMLLFEPDSPELRLRDCWCDLRLGSESAVESARALAADFPYNLDVLSYLQSLQEGRLYGSKRNLERFGDQANLRPELEKTKAEADSALRTTLRWLLAVNPRNAAVRDQLRSQNGETPIDELLEWYDSWELIEAYEAAGVETEHDAAILLDDRVTFHFDDGAERTISHQVVHVVNQSGVESYQNLSVAHHPLFSQTEVAFARVIHADGTIEDAALSPGWATFTGLEPGDYVELRTLVDEYRSGWLNRDFWDSFQFNASLPVFRTRWAVIHGPSVTPVLRVHGDAGGELKREELELEGGLKGTAIVAENLPALRPETSMPPSVDLYCWVDCSTVKDWSTIGKWYDGLSRGQAAVTPAVRAKALELCAGLPAGADTISVLADFVARKVEYDAIDFHRSSYVPEQAATTLKHGLGDCKDKSGLLIALCRAVGIEARFVLDMSGNTATTRLLPSPRFNHAIVWFPGRNRYLDPTSDAWDVDRAPAALADSWALVVDPENGGELRRLPVETEPQSESSMSLRASEGGRALQVDGELELVGAQAALLRSWLAHGTDEVKRKNFSGLLSGWAPGLCVDELSIQSLDSLAGPVRLSYRGQLPLSRAALEAGLPMPWLFVDDSPAGLESRARQHPLELSGGLLSTACRQTIRIEAGSGLRVKELPEGARHEFAGSRTIFASRREAGGWICEREDYRPRQRIEPADFPGWREATLAVHARDLEPLRIRLD